MRKKSACSAEAEQQSAKTQGCASAKRCAHACCSVSIFAHPAPLRHCVLLLHPFDLAKQLPKKNHDTDRSK
jgi:hypothetical protein